MSPKNFWRVSPSALKTLGESQETITISEPRELIYKLKPGHGVVVASWDANAYLGKVQKLGFVRAIRQGDLSADIQIRDADITLRPNPSGRRFWGQSKPFFQFADEVVIRYMLPDLFAEHFPEYSGMEFGPSPRRMVTGSSPSSFPIGGFIYVIRSPYGYKIGKTVNIKDRTRLFSVKLPFPITVEYYAWFDDYTAAERDFHRQFHSKRQEGEWFDLDDSDLLQIKAKGKGVLVDGL